MPATIITPVNQIEEMATRASIIEMNKMFPSAVNSIRSYIVSRIPVIFENSSEYKSILNGELQGHFGIPGPDAQSKLKSIVDTLANSTQVNFSPFRFINIGKITGGLSVYMFQSDFADILGLDAAKQNIDSGSFLQLGLPWLSWLLLEGDKIIITDYYFNDLIRINSRSGKGIMSRESGTYWRVPPQYAGTINDNWITRTVDKYMTVIEDIIEEAIDIYL